MVKKVHVNAYDRRPPDKKKPASWVEKAGADLDRKAKEATKKLDKDMGI